MFDIEELKRRIPKDWAKIHYNEILEVRRINIQVLLNKAAENNNCSPPDTKGQMNDLLKLESKRTGLPEEILREILAKQSCGMAISVVFQRKYGHLLPRDSNQKIHVPVDLLERFIGDKGRKLADEIYEKLSREEGLKMYAAPQNAI